MNEPQLDSNVMPDDDGPAVLEIDHGVVKKVRRGRQRVERPKPDPFKIMLSDESKRTGLGLRHIHTMLPPKTLQDWNSVDDMVEHCLRRPQGVPVDAKLAAAIETVYRKQPDKDGLLGPGVRPAFERMARAGQLDTPLEPDSGAPTVVTRSSPRRDVGSP